MTMRQRLAHIALGGVLVLSGMIASSFLQTADSQQSHTEIVKAREFHVVNAYGTTTAVIASRPNGLMIQNASSETGGRVSVTINRYGSGMYIHNAAGEIKASIYTELEWGGVLSIDAAKGNGSVFIGHNDKKNGGLVSVKGENGSAQISVNEHGGGVWIFGKGNSTSMAAMGVNEYGNGYVNTWDKNGYRLGSLLPIGH